MPASTVPSISHGPRLVLTGTDPADAVAALSRAAAEFPTAGVRTPGGLQTYPELLDRARRILTGLRASGLSAGDAAIVQGLSLDDFFATFWACLLGGIRPAVISETLSQGSPVVDRLRHTWRLLDEPPILTDRSGVAALTDSFDGADLRVIEVDDLALLPPAEDLHRPDESEVALLMLSSGSTAAPKAAALTHRALAEFAAGTRRLIDLRPGETTLNWLPVDHSGALLFYHLLPVFAGCTNVHLPTADVLTDPLLWLEKLAEYRVAHAWSPTFGLQLATDALRARPDLDLDLTGIRSLVCGGEQIVLPVVDRFFAATASHGLGRDCFRPAWGMAETTTGITIGSLTSEGGVLRVLKSSLNTDLVIAEAHVPDAECSTFVAVGPPAPGATVRVVDHDDRVLPELRIGRLQVRSARVTAGYVNNEQATAAALPDGEWLRTGDLAFVSGGEVVITGREGDIVVINGHNVFCHEIEEVAGGVDGVNPRGVGASGVPNARTGTDDLVVFFEDHGSAADVVPAIRAALFNRLRLTPARIVPVPAGEFPRTASGKVRRPELRSRYLDDQYEADSHEPAPVEAMVAAGEVTGEVRRLLADLVGDPVDDDVPFYELGLTSVLTVRLRAALTRRFGIDVPATVPFEYPTVAALAGWLTARGGSAPIEDRAASGHPTPTVDRRVAIIGMAARFPGARTIDEFWGNLVGGVDSVSVFGERGDSDLVPVGGLLDDAEAFDAEYFGLSPKEAELTDPAHRQFLEVAHQVLEHGGYSATPPDVRIGVYAGSGMNLYGHQDRLTPNGAAVADVPTAMQATIGDTADFLATRVAYRLGLTGPAIGVQTACSTSLVAVHLAVQALLDGDADLAIAGAAALRLPQDAGYRHVPGSILSPTGRCRPFDAAADGTVGGNGVAAVLLKRLDQALADGDTVHAVILGSAVNNDGTGKVGFTAPSVSGQVDVVRRALQRAGVGAETISYVEAHGTGTALGDPVEFEALSRVFGAEGRRDTRCVLGSVKSSIGHLDSCAGMAGLIKTALMLQHGQLVPTVNLTRPHPDLRIAESPFEFADSAREWRTGEFPRRAGVSALGVGGTNAHVVLEQPPAMPRTPAGATVVLPISAKSETALRELIASMRSHLAEHPELAAADVATTMALGRRRHPYRHAVIGATAVELSTALAESVPSAESAVGPLAFAFSGQGAAYPGMSDWLYRTFGAARAVFDDVERVVGRSVVDTGRAELAQVALFANQAALVDVWRSLGVTPDFVVGHSLGEYAAMYAAGVMSLADGALLTARRGELMHGELKPGAMVAAVAELPAAERIAAECGADLAAVNGPDRQVLAGDEDTIARVTAALDREGLTWRRMAVDRAFHSSSVDPVLETLREYAETITFRPARIPLISALDGSMPGTVDGRYLAAHARQPVRFDLALAAVAEQGCTRFLELGPDAVLTPIGRRAVSGSHWTRSLRKGSDTEFATALAEMYRAGAEIDWSAVSVGRRIPLPGHPLARRRFVPVVEKVMEKVVDGDSAILDKIRELIAPSLGIVAGDIPAGTPFLSLGADSLSLMKLTGELDEVFGVAVPIRRLFSDLDTPAKLAELIAQSGGIAPARQPAQPPAPLPAPPAAETAGQSGADRQPGTDVPRQQVVGAVAAADNAVREIVDRQLRLTERMVDRVTSLMSEQLALLGGAPAPAAPLPVEPPPVAVQPVEPIQQPVQQQKPAVVEPVRQPIPMRATGTRKREDCDFSLYFFGDYPDSADRDKYGLIMRAAEFADEHGFHALWLPERHFHSFGALFPNPSVLAAALATRTSRVRLHAGSVVLPLHHPIRVAEEWSVVDNLSGGRAGICVASGWHARDFVFAPDSYGRHREEMYDRLDTVRRLWAGEAITATAGNGEPTEVRLHPSPLQEQPPLFAAVVGNPESYKLAARHDIGVVTNLMTQSVEDLAANIALYRSTRAEHGLDPDAGRVVVLVHTYLGDELESTRAEAYQPFCDYLRSSLSLFGQVTNSLGFQIDLENTPADDVDFMLGQAYQRYGESRALIGTPSSCAGIVDSLLAAGVDEIACFVDFGLPTERVMDSLPLVDELRATYARRAATGRQLTPAERRMWFLEQLEPGRNTYHEAKAIDLRGPLDADALSGALQRVVDRHPALRTVFREVDGEPRAFVQESRHIDCPLIDVSGNNNDASGNNRDEVLHAALRAVPPGDLDLSAGPLIFAQLLRLSDEHHVLLLVAHHIVFDSASTPVFARDLAAYYRAWPEDPGLPACTDGLADQATGTAADLDFWRDWLAAAPELRLPTDRPRPPARSGAGGCVTYDLDGELTERIASFAKQARTTVFSTLLAGLGVVLARFSGQQDFVIGTGVSGRDKQSRDAIGMFIDTIPLRVKVPGGIAFSELARELGLSTMDAFTHRGVPFDELVAALNPQRDLGRNPLFSVAVEFESTAEEAVFAPPVSATLLDLPAERAPLDLVLYLTQRPDGLRCVVEYDTDLYDEATIQRLLAYLELTLDLATARADVQLTELAALTEHDSKLLAELEGERGESPARCLHELFEDRVDRDPEALALTGAYGDLTYAELDRRANQIAHELLSRGVGRGDLVGICLPRGPELISALLGVLKCGAGYLPLDPAVPPDRLRFMLADSSAVLVVTGDGTPDLDAPSRLLIEQLGDGPVSRPRVEVAPDDLAYCIYTSGSTGMPKGVLVPHRGTVNHVLAQIAAHPGTTGLQWASPMFDGSVHEIFTTLGSGRPLVLIDDSTRYDPTALADTIRRYDVQRITMPFSAVHSLLATRPSLPSLRHIISAGEATTPTTVEHDFLAAHPECALYNAYGPTEASIGVSEHRVGTGETAPPIGRPIPGVRLRLLDAERRPVPVGAVGEICAEGICVTDGYLGRPEETAAAFFAPDCYATGDLGRWRADGSLEFHGRRDDQVQIRGVRIEPGEIQHALLEHPEVTDAAVGVVDGELVGYLVGTVEFAALTEQLATRLPQYLVPRRWVRLHRLPLTTTGKLDRTALPAPDGPRVITAPTSTAQQTVHALWCKTLGLTELGIDDSFFERGGHSLLVVQLLNQVREVIGADFTMTEFFRAPTIRSMAAKIEVEETAPATFAQRRALRRHRARADASVYNGITRVDITGELDVDALRDALEAMVRRHSALRTRVVDDRVVDDRQEVLTSVSVALPVDDLSESGIHDWCVGAARPAMDPAQAPLWRIRLGRVSAQRWVLVMVVHHLIYDGWSSRLFWQELSALYRGDELPLPAAQFTDYARWELAALTGQTRAELESFWRAELAGASLRPDLRVDQPRPEVLSGNGSSHHVDLPTELADDIRAAAAAAGTTPYVVIAAAFARWLGELSGQDDVVLPASSARRTRPEHNGVIGYLGEAVLVRVKLDAEDLFAETARALYAALDHEALPLAEVVRVALPDQADQPYPAVLFTVITTPSPTLSLTHGDFPIQSVAVPGEARTELYVVFTLTDQSFTLDIEYATDLFTSATIAQRATTLITTLTSISRRPSR